MRESQFGAGIPGSALSWFGVCTSGGCASCDSSLDTEMINHKTLAWINLNSYRTNVACLNFHNQIATGRHTTKAHACQSPSDNSGLSSSTGSHDLSTITATIFDISVVSIRKAIPKLTRTTRTPAFWGYPPLLMITHTIESYWIPSQKKTKSKLQI